MSPPSGSGATASLRSQFEKGDGISAPPSSQVHTPSVLLSFAPIQVESAKTVRDASPSAASFSARSSIRRSSPPRNEHSASASKWLLGPRQAYTGVPSGSTSPSQSGFGNV